MARLIVNPLIEENMEQMVDGEFSINQYTGHVTYKKEDSYISKTKELSNKILVIKNMYEDLSSKVTQDIEERDNVIDKVVNMEDKTDNITKNVIDLQELLETDINDLDNFMTTLNEIEVLLNEFTSALNQENNQDDLLSSISNFINLYGKINSYKERLDSVLNNESYFERYVKNQYSYYDVNKTNSEAYSNFNTINTNACNTDNIKLLVDSSDYTKVKNFITGLYARLIDDNRVILNSNITKAEVFTKLTS